MNKKLFFLLISILFAHTLFASDEILFLEKHEGVTDMTAPNDVAISPDGKHVYISSHANSSVSIFERDLSTGLLSYLGNVKDGSGGVTHMQSAFGVDVSPDGKNIYVASPSSSTIVSFSRNSITGGLSLIDEDYSGFSVRGFVSVSVSPDGKTVYGIAGSTDGIAAFSRNPTTGTLTFLEEYLDGSTYHLGQGYSPTASPINNIAFTETGDFMFVTSTDDNAVTSFSRNTSTGVLTLASVVIDGSGGVDGIQGASSLYLTPDNKHLYVSGQNENAVAIFSVNTTTGLLTYINKLVDGVGGITSIATPRAMGGSPDGRYIYVSGYGDNAITAFERNSSTGLLSLAEVAIDEVSGADGFAGPNGMITDQNNRHLYLCGSSEPGLAVFKLTTPGVELSTTTATATEQGSAIILDNGLNVFDSDDTHLESASITITSGKIATDELTITASGGVVATPSDGKITLTGSATLETYRDILRSVQFQTGIDNSIGNGETSERTISFIVNDGENESNEVSITVIVNGVSSAVTTTAISLITSTSASSGGNVISDGGETITARGVCWNTSTEPAITNSKTTEAGTTGVFSSSITGLTASTTYYVRAYATNSIGTAYGNEVSFITSSDSNTWDGSTDTDWGTADNWSDNAVPTSSTDAVIPSGQTVIISPTTSASCADLSNSGTLTIQSDATHSGSLIVSGTSTGTITYQRYVTENRWHLVGSPVTGQDIGDLLVNAANDIVFSSPNYSMKDYIENTDNWSASYTASTDGDFTLGKGYAAKRNSDGVISFTGTVNTSSVTRTLSRSRFGWTLVSNPYTSAIGVTTGATSSNLCLSTSNCNILDESFAALYLWDEQAGYTGSRNDYKTISNAGGGILQHYVQVGQGFFVKSKSGGGSFEFTTGMQIHETETDFKSTEDIWPTIRLNVQSDDLSSYTQVCYHEDMSRGLDVSYDAGMLKANPNFALYSRLVEDNGVDFAMQCLPEDYEYLVIPIGIDASSGTALTFTAETLNLPEDYRVVIEDRKLGIFTTLETSEDYYSATISAFDDLPRFFLHTKSSYLAIEDPELNDGLQIIPQPQNHLIQVIGEVGDNAQLLLYDMTGRILLTTMLEQTEMNEVKVGSLKSGTYVIIIRSETKNSSKKLNWIQ